MAKITYPRFLGQKLTKNAQLLAAVNSTIVDFDAWLQDSKLPFFPDYTDHGITHITEVLETAENLIDAKARKLFTPEDAAVLILAVLLHDAALHLSEAGFYDLIRGRQSNLRRIDGLDDASWPELWQEFLFAARRWDDHKLIGVFGASDPGVPAARVEDPFPHYDNLRESDRKLIGEFIRQHHPRLAHDFSIHGVPGPGDNPIRPSPRFGREKLDIAGLIARSHGLPLRNCLDYLKRYHRREYQHVHAVFLMTLIRIADYLQIQPGRASSVAFRFKRISSPISQLEQRAHSAIKNITQAHDDPDTLEIQAAPDDLNLFTLLDERFTDIQKELDTSWAVLGEVYGSDKRLSKLGLTIRRVRSNLEDKQTFMQNASFFPERVEFSVANAELMKLLIGPLYGQRPEVGIRELMQNAVDACRELKDWRARHPECVNFRLIEQDGDVEVWLNQESHGGPGVLTVSDRGIGMTEKVVRDYFLKIGASYRQSHAWQREFEWEEEEAPLRSRVLRSGRFGIGILAAFLLGDEIEVSTRHVTSSRGFTFRTRLEAGLIELRYEANLAVGTTVRVPLRTHYYGSDKAWDWYCFDSPVVLRRTGPEKKILPQEMTLPGSPDQLPTGWYSIEAPGFSAVYVSPKEVDGKIQHLVCNGIKIGDRTDTTSSWSESGRGEFRLLTPATVVLDPDGNLPIDLTRSKLTEKPSFRDEVERVACESLLAGLLLNAPTNQEATSTIGYLSSRFRRAWAEMVSFSPWLFTKHGITVATPWNILQTGVDRILVDFSEGLRLPHSSPATQHGSFIYGEDDTLDVLFSGSPLEPIDLIGLRLLVTASYGRHILELAHDDAFLYSEELREEWTDGTWSLLAHRDCPAATCIDLAQLPAPSRRSSIWPVAVEWFFDRKIMEVPQGLPYYWQTIIRNPVIPYSQEERKVELDHAYQELRSYFEEHQRVIVIHPRQ